VKRGAPMRRTPLARGTSQLKRSPLAAGCSQLRRTPINPVSRKRVQDNRQRTIVVNAMRLAAEGRCARCGRADVVVHGHERLGRSQGGNPVAPDCLLDNFCNEWCESHPQIAAWTGWKVSSKWPHDPQLEVGQAVDLFGNIVQFHTDADLEAS
jgi:hypothetical protein